MAHRSAARPRPVVDAAPRIHIVRTDATALTGGGVTALLESATQRILAATYWFDPAPNPGPYPVAVRFSGRRVDVKGRFSPGDRFVQDETIEEVVPGSGPISLTARVRGINAGSWAVTAPGLLVAMAVGRVGCFFAGCCGGPPTASRWGVWGISSLIHELRLAG